VESFNYLSVLISIILGLAITQVLQAVRGLILTRKRVRLYTPTVIWTALALLIAIQAWWASFSMHTRVSWNFLSLLVIVLQAISIYMMAALVLPDPKEETIVELREHYLAHRIWFFGAQLGAVVFSLAKTLILSGHLAEPLDTNFQLIFGVASVAAMTIRREWFHKALAPTLGVLFVLYIALIFYRLQS
jgi:hypothetical protein